MADDAVGMADDDDDGAIWFDGAPLRGLAPCATLGELKRALAERTGAARAPAPGVRGARVDGGADDAAWRPPPRGHRVLLLGTTDAEAEAVRAAPARLRERERRARARGVVDDLSAEPPAAHAIGAARGGAAVAPPPLADADGVGFGRLEVLEGAADAAAARGV